MQNMGHVTVGGTTGAPTLQIPPHLLKMVPQTYVASTQSLNQTNRAPEKTHAQEPSSNRLKCNPFKVTQAKGNSRLQVWPQLLNPCLEIAAARVVEVTEGKAILNRLRQSSGHPRDPVCHLISGYTNMARYLHKCDHPSLIYQTRQNVSNLARTSRVLVSLKNGKELR